MDRFLQQFFDRKLWWVWGGLLALHIIAALLMHSTWSAVPLVAIGIATFVVSLRSMTHGLALAMIEMFVGGHGHLLDAEIGGFHVGIRMVMFGAVMLAWLVELLRRRLTFRFVAQRDMPWVFLVIAVFLGSIVGFLRNDFRQAFDDMNSYLTIGYILPIITTMWTPERKRVLLQAFFASAAWIAGTTLAMWYTFTHLPGMAAGHLYRFVRDTRLAEVTLLSGPEYIVQLFPNGDWFYRIFQQSQFIVIVFEIVLVVATFMLWRNERIPKYVYAWHTLMISAIVAGMSRSFWIGFGAAGMFAVAALLADRVRPKAWLRAVGVGLLSKAAALLVLWLLIVIPLPPRPDVSTSPFYKGEGDNTRDLAVSSRWNLLGPMMEKIGEEPLWGSGFGTDVTFVSDDPRVREINPSGEWTTYRFEWGFQDIWIKMGIPGLLAVAWYFGVVMYAVWRSIADKREWRWLSIGLGAGVVALFATHAFSPYLNHPIGIGFMLFVVPFLGWNRLADAQEMAIEKQSAASLGNALARPNIGIVTAEIE